MEYLPPLGRDGLILVVALSSPKQNQRQPLFQQSAHAGAWRRVLVNVLDVADFRPSCADFVIPSGDIDTDILQIFDKELRCEGIEAETVLDVDRRCDCGCGCRHDRGEKRIMISSSTSGAVVVATTAIVARRRPKQLPFGVHLWGARQALQGAGIEPSHKEFKGVRIILGESKAIFEAFFEAAVESSAEEIRRGGQEILVEAPDGLRRAYVDLYDAL